MFCYSVGSLLQVVYPSELHFNIDIYSKMCYQQIIDSIFENKIRSGISILLSTTNSNENGDACVLNGPVISANYAIKKYSVKRLNSLNYNEI